MEIYHFMNDSLYICVNYSSENVWEYPRRPMITYNSYRIPSQNKTKSKLPILN